MTDQTERDESQANPEIDPISAEALVAAYGKVESKTPGRMRVRMKDELRTPGNMDRVEQQLKKNPHVSHVTVNKKTGSVAFEHDKTKDGHSVLSATLQEAELLVDVAFEVPEDDEEGGDAQGKLDQQLADAMYRVDSWIYRKTGLRTKGRVLPATIAGLGLGQLLVYGISLETLPGPVLIWIGWDIYHRFGKEPALSADVAGDTPIESRAPAEHAPGPVSGAPAAA